MKKMNIVYIILSFIGVTICSIIIPLALIQLFAVPIMLIIIYWFLKNEISYPDSINKQTLQMAYKAFFISLFTQALLNLFSMQATESKVGIPLTTQLPIIPVYAVLLAPIVEETLFRYIVFGCLQGSKEKFSILAAVVSSTLFGILHMNATLFLGYFAVGFTLCYFYFRTKNIIVVVLAHMFLNFFALFSQSLHLTFGGL